MIFMVSECRGITYLIQLESVKVGFVDVSRGSYSVNSVLRVVEVSVVGQMYVGLSSHSGIEMWNFLVDRTRHGVKCDYRQHCVRAARGAVRARPGCDRSAPPPAAGAGAHAALRRRRRDARSRCARVRYLQRLHPRYRKDLIRNIAKPTHTRSYDVLNVVMCRGTISKQWLLYWGKFVNEK